MIVQAGGASRTFPFDKIDGKSPYLRDEREVETLISQRLSEGEITQQGKSNVLLKDFFSKPVLRVILSKRRKEGADKGTFFKMLLLSPNDGCSNRTLLSPGHRATD